jgi:hypothetical protein
VLLAEEAMTLSGHVENGKIVLDESVPLTEGMKVRIELVGAAPEANGGPTESVDEESLPTLYDSLKQVIGVIKDAPPDYARNLDHYLYGVPKK